MEQGRQELTPEPGEGETKPGGQSRHWVVAGASVSAYVPGLHGVHCELLFEAAPETLPAMHGTQSLALVARAWVLKVLTGQGFASMPSAQKKPSGQSKQAAEPATE